MRFFGGLWRVEFPRFERAFARFFPDCSEAFIAAVDVGGFLDAGLTEFAKKLSVLFKVGGVGGALAHGFLVENELVGELLGCKGVNLVGGNVDASRNPFALTLCLREVHATYL